MTIGSMQNNYQSYAMIKPKGMARIADEKLQSTVAKPQKIEYEQYIKKQPVNMAEVAIAQGKPENKPSQMSQSYVDGMRSFDVYDSKMSESFTAMRKQVQQKILSDALLTKAVIIRNTHESTGERSESAK